MAHNKTLQLNCLSVRPSVVSLACGNFTLAIKKLICSRSIGSSAPRNTRLFSLGETFANIDILDDSASCWSIGNLELGKTFALRFVWLALIGAFVRSVCDNVCSAFKDTFGLTVLLQELLCRIAPASSSRDSASSQLSACHRLDHPPRPHRRSCGRRRPHP